MLTLKAVLETTTGLYRDSVTGREFLHDELLASLPADVLACRVHLQRVRDGTYMIYVHADGARAYQLLSRRRVPRLTAP